MAVTATGTPVAHSPADTEPTSTFSVTVPSGTTKLLVGVGVVSGSAQTITSVTWNTSEALSVGVTQAHTGFTSNADAIYYLDNPTAATANVVVVYSGNNRPTCIAACFSGTAAGLAATAANPAGTSTSLTAAVGGVTVTFCNVSVNNDVPSLTVANGQTVLAQAAQGGGAGSGGRSGMAYLAGTGSPATIGWTPGGPPDDQGIVAVALAAAAAGPTIDTQPTAQTAILAGPYADTSVDFTVSATTSGGTLHYAWTFNSISVGTDSATYTRSGIVSGDNGHTAQVAVTDDNGTTNSDTAALTVKAGVTLTNASGTTQADGTLASALTVTSDDSSAGHELTRITCAAGGVTIGTHVITVAAP